MRLAWRQRPRRLRRNTRALKRSGWSPVRTETRGHALRAHQTSTRGHRLPRGARSRRQGGAGEGSALEPRGMGAGSAPARSGQGARGPGQEPRPRARADPLRADAGLAVHVLSRRGGDHGDGPREDPRVRVARPGMRRCPPLELRCLRRPGPPSGLGRQRLRRDPPGPWEWDLKRLAASFAIAGRDRDFTPKETRAAVLRTVRSYREAMREFAAMRNLDVWYARLDVDTLLADLAKVADRKQMKAAQKNVAKAEKKNSMKAFDRLVRVVDGEPRIISDPPLLVPAASSSPRIRPRSSRSGSSSCSAVTARASRETVATSSTATGSSRWPARWSGSAASGPAPGWC